MKNFVVNLRLAFDTYSLIFLASCALIFTLVTFFSHRYLHRDPGYRRFFITISLFSFGINLIILAGAFDLIFMGWEIVGLSSFLLIGYFWHRPKAIAAATRAYYIYRVTDLGFLVSLLITHFFWHDVNIFQDFLNAATEQAILPHLSLSWRWLLSICILLPVLGKSAQFPLCFWLPKAMEGPTHSSAIFYGSISIHIGVFLLLRTRPIWYFTDGFTYLLFAIGFLTAFCATLFALVQSNIKGQIGYASVAQVGLMLVELSFGCTTLVFVHMMGNAFLRCFQLLVSGSILTTHLHMQHVVRTFGQIHSFSLPNIFPKKMLPSLYLFALNDGYFEDILKKLLVSPLMIIARNFNHIICGNIHELYQNLRRLKRVALSEKSPTLRSFSPLLFLLALGILADVLLRSFEMIRIFSIIVGIVLVLASIGEDKKPINALLFIIFGNLFAFLSIYSSRPGLLYLIGLSTSSLIAFEALRFINLNRTIKDLGGYHGLFQQFPLAASVFLLGILGIISFPFSSTFYGEDILLELSIDSGFYYLIMFQALFILSGIAAMRLYAILMLGVRDNYIKDINLDFTPRHMFLRILLLALGNTAAFVIVLL